MELIRSQKDWAHEELWFAQVPDGGADRIILYLESEVDVVFTVCELKAYEQFPSLMV